MSAAGGSALGTVRRLIVFVLLFALVVIAATGVAGLLGRLLDAGRDLTGGTADLALQLAYALIAGPLAALLWWATWRRLRDPSERDSLAWGLYLTAMLTLAVVLATIGFGTVLAAAAAGRWEPGALVDGVVWTLVWLWHRWMLRHPARGPRRMPTVPAVIGAAYGLVLGAAGAIGAIGGVVDVALAGSAGALLVGPAWWVPPLQSAAWALVGGATWWVCWAPDGARRSRTVFAAVALVLVGVLAAAATALGGLGTAIFVGLRLAFDSGDPFATVTAPLGTALAAAGVGAAVWRAHTRIAASRDASTRRAGVLVVAALGLAGAASGIGVIVNTALAGIADPIADSGTRTLLLGGISALLVGGPTWWLHWRPLRRPAPEEAAEIGRRVYLVVVFGASAVVALVALLVIAARVFEFALDPSSADVLVDRLRAPLGLLVATGLVFAYHFSVWRRDREETARAGIAPSRRVARIVLVAATAEPDAVERAVASATGARVAVWRRAAPLGGADAASPDAGPADAGPADAGPSGAEALPGEAATGEPAAALAAAVAAAVAGVDVRRVLVVADPGEGVRVIPLLD